MRAPSARIHDSAQKEPIVFARDSSEPSRIKMKTTATTSAELVTRYWSAPRKSARPTVMQVKQVDLHFIENHILLVGILNTTRIDPMRSLSLYNIRNETLCVRLTPRIDSPATPRPEFGTSGMCILFRGYPALFRWSVTSFCSMFKLRWFIGLSRVQFASSFMLYHVCVGALIDDVQAH